jgi:hypothetical protein
MSNDLRLAGWREWLALPELGIPAIRAKLDTGARSSALHVDDMSLFDRDGERWVRFALRPGPDLDRVEKEAHVIDIRPVTDSGGRTRERPFIRTVMELADGTHWPIDMNLTNRADMLFPMLLGRTAMAGRLLVDSAQSFLLGRPDHR